MAKGEGWLAAHPEREQIARRYLRHQRHLVREAVARLVADDVTDLATTDDARAAEEDQIERRLSLNERKIG